MALFPPRDWPGKAACFLIENVAPKSHSLRGTFDRSLPAAKEKRILAHGQPIEMTEILDAGITTSVAGRVYENRGNAPLIALLEPGCRRLLDVGCGAGDNALLVKCRFPDCDIFGITLSSSEAERARSCMQHCWVLDIENRLPECLKEESFDALIFSHVLEHLRSPAEVLARFSRLLRKGGQALIAVPNILNWKMRLQFLGGDFRYRSSGVLDDTHLRFFTYATADQYLITPSVELKLVTKTVTCNLPFRRVWSRILPAWCVNQVESLACRRLPNLLGWQVLLHVVKL
jgi:SAM-dependent methyltransferase